MKKFTDLQWEFLRGVVIGFIVGVATATLIVAHLSRYLHK